MDNSLEILQGSADTIRKQYEVLADLIKEYNGKTHGYQSHILVNNSIQLIVCYEVPDGLREEIKRTFEFYSKNWNKSFLSSKVIKKTSLYGSLRIGFGGIRTLDYKNNRWTWKTKAFI